MKATLLALALLTAFIPAEIPKLDAAPHIVFRKDSAGEDQADVNEKLFTGFGTGSRERGINAPT